MIPSHLKGKMRRRCSSKDCMSKICKNHKELADFINYASFLFSYLTDSQVNKEKHIPLKMVRYKDGCENGNDV